MKLSEVKKLTPFERLCYWITERESIRLKKEAGEKKPWTDDECLSAYRFCNVRRMDDKVSRWLEETWYKPYFNHKNMLWACCIARFFNKPESLGKVTQLVFQNSSWSQIKTDVSVEMRRLKEKGETIFNGAYMVRGNDGCDKVSSVMDYYVQSVVDKKIKVDSTSMEGTWSDLKECYGWGSFMAGQVVADLRHAVEGTWLDKLTWAPIGPGSQRGMNRLLERPLKNVIPQKQFENELTFQYESLKKTLPSSIVGRIELMDLQNCLCEYDKFNRVVNSEGTKPKQKYDGGLNA